MMTMIRSSIYETLENEAAPVFAQRLSTRRGLIGLGLLLTLVVIIPVLVRLNNA